MKYIFTLALIFLISLNASAKKNILFIIVDDLRPELGCYGNTTIQTPHIDKLATQGMVFNRAYCQQAICGASRASFLTGLRPDSSKVFDIHTKVKNASPKHPTLPGFFKSQGYTTTSLGKVYHHIDDDPRSWSEKPSLSTGNWFGKQGYHDERLKEFPTTTWITNAPCPVMEKLELEDKDYPDGVIAEQAITKLQSFKESQTPFFIAIGFQKPHLPFNAPKKYWDLYDPNELYKSTVKNWPKNISGWAPRYSEELRNYEGIIQGRERIHGEMATQLIHGYYACTSYIDAQIGKVLNKVRELGMDQNTIIILTGDHGFKLGDYGSWCKHTNFEIDTRVPLIISTPSQTPGKTESLAEMVDIYPTLADLCSFELPKHCEGTSLKSILRNPQAEVKELAISQYPRKNGKIMGYSMRYDKWRYTEWIEPHSGKIKSRELYRHDQSPLSPINEIFNPEHAELISQLSKILNKGQGWKN